MSLLAYAASNAGWLLVTLGILAAATFGIAHVLDRAGLTVTDDYQAATLGDDRGFAQHCAKEQQR